MRARITPRRLRATLATTLLAVSALWTVDFAALAGAVQAPAGTEAPRRFETRQLSEHFWAEGATTADINRDGRQDIVSGPFWYEGPAFTQRHEFMPATESFERKRDDGAVETVPGFEGGLGTRNVYSENFLAFTYDFNRDGWPDILIVGHPGRATHWYENPRGAGQGQHWKPHLLHESVANESPAFVDITGDGRPEIVCNSGGYFGYMEQTSDDPTAPWTFRPISPQGKWGPYTHGLGVGDINGDGRPDIVEATAWWEQPASLDGHPVWTRHAADFGAGAQILVYDVNDDGLADVIGSLNAHEWGLAWHEQVRDSGQISFRRHLIMGSRPDEMPHGVAFSQPHAIALADIDRDGLRDIVTGKRFWAHGRDGDPEPNAPAVVYWFQLVRTGSTVEWVPHLVDDNSGVGTQVWVADATGDGLPDIVVGNKKGVFLHVQQRIETPRPADPAANMTPAPARVPFVGLRPDEAAKAMTLPPGFRAQVFAGEPDVRQPVAFAIDDRGRVWVAEAYAYPVRQPEGQGRDRILVFEDIDGDGRFDRRTIFADDLNLVSALEVGFGGVWVGAAPYLMFIPIADGDAPTPAGPPRILLDGWGDEDTHETLNSMIWGPDGWLYGAHGVFTHSAVGAPGTPAAERKRINGGIWRYHPTKHRFEVFAEGLSNPWGLDFTERGHAVAVACVIPHLWHIVQGGRYQRQAGQHFNAHYYDDLRTIGDHLHYVGASPWAGNNQSGAVGGGHAHAGLMVYQGTSWPAEYRGQTFMNNIHGARINVDVLEPAGSGYVGRHGADFLDFNDRASQVVNLQYDHDGSVYMIDWYDQEQCHVNDPDVPDRGNGRIYKVVYGDTPTTKVDVQAETDEALVLAQLSRNEWRVRHARRVLQERAVAGTLDAMTIPRLRALAGLERSVVLVMVPDGPEYHPVDGTAARLRLIWALHAVSGMTDAHMSTLLHDRDEYVRAWLVQLATEDEPHVSPVVGQELARLAHEDVSPTVRLYLASAAQRVPPNARWAIVEGLHGREMRGDHNLPMMSWYALEGLVEDDAARALALARSSQAPRALEFAARRVAAVGSRETVDRLVAVLRDTPDAAARLAMLTGINAALVGQRQIALPDGWTDLEETLEASGEARVRSEAQALALTFGSPRALASARRTLGDHTLSAESRGRALEVLLNVRDEALPPLLLDALGDRRLRPAAIRGLASFDSAEAPSQLLELYPALPAAERRDVLQTLASRPAYARVLVDALASGRVPAGDLPADIARHVRLLDQPDVTATLEKVWGVARSDNASMRAATARYTALVENTDLPRPSTSHGRGIFVNTCAACHKLFGEGGDIGPDITGSNRASLDYLLHNILNPNAEIPNAYRAATVELHDGRVMSGIANVQGPVVVSVQTSSALVSVPRADVKSIVQSDVSMMPEGLLNPLSDEDVRNLIAYLRSMRQVPLPVEP